MISVGYQVCPLLARVTFPVNSRVKVQLQHSDETLSWYYGTVSEILEDENEKRYRINFGYTYEKYEPFESKFVHDGNDYSDSLSLQWEPMVVKLTRNPNASHFRVPFSSNSYLRVVRQPMDLTSVCDRLKRRMYSEF